MVLGIGKISTRCPLRCISDMSAPTVSSAVQTFGAHNASTSKLKIWSSRFFQPSTASRPHSTTFFNTSPILHWTGLDVRIGRSLPG